MPEALLRNRGLSRGAQQLYGQLARYAGEDGNCFPSQETLAWDFEVSERTIQRWLAELVAAQLIRPSRRANGRGNQYEFVWNDMFDRGQMLLVHRGDSVENHLIFEPSTRQNWRVATEPSLCEESTLPREIENTRRAPAPILYEPKAPNPADSEVLANDVGLEILETPGPDTTKPETEIFPRPAPLSPRPATIAAPDTIPPPPPPRGLKSPPTARNTARAAAVPPSPRQFSLPHALIEPPAAVPRAEQICSAASQVHNGRKPPGLVRAGDVLAQWRAQLAKMGQPK